MQATYHKHILEFKRPSGTSRGILKTKETWFIVITSEGKHGFGECGILRTLSIDDRPDYEEKLKWTCNNINLGPMKLWEELKEFPSIQFGVEMAFRSLERSDPFHLFPSKFTRGEDSIIINGLIWMGDSQFMEDQIKEKLGEGFSCIKMKIGAIDFTQELELLSSIRSKFSKEEIELRVDANGAFLPDEALDKLRQLYKFELHSIEQPIEQGQHTAMKDLCAKSPLPIALDEELIGIFDVMEKKELLQTIKPHYIILKPSLIGGYKGTQQWIDLADSMNIGWWITSALESNIGLNAIAQYTYSLQNKMPQGLGTGSLYTNNIESPLVVSKGVLSYESKRKWNVKFLK